MSEQMTAKVDVDLAQPSILSRRNPLRYVMLLAGLAVLVMLPYWIYPPVAMDILCWGLFAISVDLLLGFTGCSASATPRSGWLGLLHRAHRDPLGRAVPGRGARRRRLLDAHRLADRLPVRAAHGHLLRHGHPRLRADALLRRQPGPRPHRGENGLQGIPRNFFGIESVETDPFYFYYVGAVLILLGILVAWRVVNSPFGRVLTAVRDNPARARALGYDVERYKITAFIISAGLAGLAGGVFAVSHQFASLQELMWTTSGKVVLVTVLGGIGTLWGGLVGAGVVVTLEDYLASSGFEGIGLITGTIFVLIVLLFRHGIWGTGRNVLRRYVLDRRRQTRD